MRNSISQESILNLQRILMDGDIRKTFLLDDEKIPKLIKIQKDGSLLLGETSSTLWNRLLGCEKKLSFSDLALHLIQIMSGIGRNQNVRAANGMYEDFINLSIKENNLDKAVESLFLSYMLGFRRNREKESVDGKENSTISNSKISIAEKQISKQNYEKKPQGFLIETLDGVVVYSGEGFFRL